MRYASFSSQTIIKNNYIFVVYIFICLKLVVTHYHVVWLYRYGADNAILHITLKFLKHELNNRNLMKGLPRIVDTYFSIEIEQNVSHFYHNMSFSLAS
jgi:hypothetical protein